MRASLALLAPRLISDRTSRTAPSAVLNRGAGLGHREHLTMAEPRPVRLRQRSWPRIAPVGNAALCTLT